KIKTTANSRLPQWGLTWLNQVQCFYQHLCLVVSYVLRNPPLRQAAKRCGEIALRDSFATTWRQPALPVAQSLPTVDFAQLAVWQNHSARKLRLRSVTSPSCRHVSHNLKKMKVK